MESSTSDDFELSSRSKKLLSGAEKIEKSHFWDFSNLFVSRQMSKGEKKNFSLILSFLLEFSCHQ